MKHARKSSVRIISYNASHTTDVVALVTALQDHVAKLDPLQRLRSGKNFNGKAYLHAWLKETKGHNRIFVAKQHDTVVGMIALFTLPERRTGSSALGRKKHLGSTGHIAEIIVADTARNTGAGNALLARAEAYFRSKKCRAIFLSCLSTNATALAFYARAGYISRTQDLCKTL